MFFIMFYVIFFLILVHSKTKSCGGFSPKRVEFNDQQSLHITFYLYCIRKLIKFSKQKIFKKVSKNRRNSFLTANIILLRIKELGHFFVIPILNVFKNVLLVFIL